MPIRRLLFSRWPAVVAAHRALLVSVIFAAVGLPAAFAQETAPAQPAAEAPAPAAPPAAAGQSEPLAEPEPITEEVKELYRQFDEQHLIWARTLTEMKQIQILYSNDEDRSPQSMQRYRELRDRAREEMRAIFGIAVRLFEARRVDFESASLLATMLDYRRENSIYEDSFHAAQMLIDAEVTVPSLYLMAARSAFVDGHFDEVMPLYERFVDVHGAENLEMIDQQIAGTLDFYPQWWEEELKYRRADAQADDLPRVLLETSRGPVLIELFEDQAPNTVANFIRLVEEEFYDGLEFYQVLDDLLAMGGDPAGDGTGTSGRFIPDEYDRPDRRRIFRGSLFMAKMPDGQDNGGFIADTASSQFVIALMPIIPKDQSQTVFGRVIEGMDVVSSFQRIDPQKKKEEQLQMPPDRILTARVVRKRNHDYSVAYTR